MPLVEIAAPPATPTADVPEASHGHPRLSTRELPRVEASEAERLRSLSGTLLDGRYRLGHRIGEGGMSWVYAGEDLEAGRSVAVKMLPPRLVRDAESVERLRREAEIAGRLEHPNVCPILRLGTAADGALYLVMPLLQGETLADFETRNPKVSLDEALPLLVQICRGLQHAHELGIVHRDLKPENVMLVPDTGRSVPRAVVMDFGLAKEHRAGSQVAKLTKTGIVLGTPEFMSPEQIRGRPLDGRSDVYALGILAFELLTGELPFSGSTGQDMMLARLRGSPRSIRAVRPELSSRLEQVIARAIALVPDDRYQTMNEFAIALEGCADAGILSRMFRRRAPAEPPPAS